MTIGVLQSSFLPKHRIARLIKNICVKIYKSQTREMNTPMKEFEFEPLIGKEFTLDVGNKRQARILIPASSSRDTETVRFLDLAKEEDF